MKNLFKWTVILFAIIIFPLEKSVANVLLRKPSGARNSSRSLIIKLDSTLNNRSKLSRDVVKKSELDASRTRKNLVQFRDSNNKVIATLRDPRTWNSANVTLSKFDDFKRLQQELRSVAVFKDVINNPLGKEKEKASNTGLYKKHFVIHAEQKHFGNRTTHESNKLIRKNLVQFRDSNNKVIATLRDPRNWNSANVTLSKVDDFKRLQQEFRSLTVFKDIIKKPSVKSAQRQEIFKPQQIILIDDPKNSSVESNSNSDVVVDNDRMMDLEGMAPNIKIEEANEFEEKEDFDKNDQRNFTIEYNEEEDSQREMDGSFSNSILGYGDPIDNPLGDQYDTQRPSESTQTVLNPAYGKAKKEVEKGKDYKGSLKEKYNKSSALHNKSSLGKKETEPKVNLVATKNAAGGKVELNRTFTLNTTEQLKATSKSGNIYSGINNAQLNASLEPKNSTFENGSQFLLEKKTDKKNQTKSVVARLIEPEMDRNDMSPNVTMHKKNHKILFENGNESLQVSISEDPDKNRQKSDKSSLTHEIFNNGNKSFSTIDGYKNNKSVQVKETNKKNGLKYILKQLNASEVENLSLRSSILEKEKRLRNEIEFPVQNHHSFRRRKKESPKKRHQSFFENPTLKKRNSNGIFGRSFIFDKSNSDDNTNRISKESDIFERYDDGLYDSPRYDNLLNDKKDLRNTFRDDGISEILRGEKVNNESEESENERSEIFPVSDFNALKESEELKKKVERVKTMRHVFHPTINLEDLQESSDISNATFSEELLESHSSQTEFYSPAPTTSSTRQATTAPFLLTKAIDPFAFTTTPNPKDTRINPVYNSRNSLRDINSRNSLRGINSLGDALDGHSESNTFLLENKYNTDHESPIMINKTDNRYNLAFHKLPQNIEKGSAQGKSVLLSSPHIVMDIGFYPPFSNKEISSGNNKFLSGKSSQIPPRLQRAQSYESYEESDINGPPDADDLLDEKYASEETKNLAKYFPKNRSNFSGEENESSANKVIRAKNDFKAEFHELSGKENEKESSGDYGSKKRPEDREQLPTDYQIKGDSQHKNIAEKTLKPNVTKQAEKQISELENGGEHTRLSEALKLTNQVTDDTKAQALKSSSNSNTSVSPTKISIKFHITGGSTGDANQIKELVIPIDSFTPKIAHESHEANEDEDVTTQLSKIFLRLLSKSSKDKLHRLDKPTDVKQALIFLKNLSKTSEGFDGSNQLNKNANDQEESNDQHKSIESHDLKEDLKSAIQSIVKEMKDERSQTLLLNSIDKNRNPHASRKRPSKGQHAETNEESRNDALDLAIKIINSEIKKTRKEASGSLTVVPQLLEDELRNEENSRNKTSEDFLNFSNIKKFKNDKVKNMQENKASTVSQENVPANVIVDPSSTSVNLVRNTLSDRTLPVKHEGSLSTRQFNELLPSDKKEMLTANHQRKIEPKFRFENSLTLNNNDEKYFSLGLKKQTNDFKRLEIENPALKVTGVIQPSEYKFHDGSHLINENKIVKDSGWIQNVKSLPLAEMLPSSECSCDTCPCESYKHVVNENSRRRQATTLSSYDNENTMSSRSPYENFQPTSAPYFMTSKSAFDFSKQYFEQPCIGDFCSQKSCVSPPCYNQQVSCFSPPCTFSANDWKVSQMSYGSACFCPDSKPNCSCQIDNETSKLPQFPPRPILQMNQNIPLCNNQPCIQQPTYYSCANPPCQLQNAGNYRCTNSPCQQYDGSQQCFNPPCFSPQTSYQYNRDFGVSSQNCGNGKPCGGNFNSYINNYENTNSNFLNTYQPQCTNSMMCCNNSPCWNNEFKYKKKQHKGNSQDDANDIDINIENKNKQEDNYRTSRPPTQKQTRKVLIVFAPTQPPKVIYAPMPVQVQSIPCINGVPQVTNKIAPETISAVKPTCTSDYSNRISQPISNIVSEPTVIKPTVIKPSFVESYSNNIPQPLNKVIETSNFEKPTIVTGYSNRIPQRISNQAIENRPVIRPTLLSGYSNSVPNPSNKEVAEYNPSGYSNRVPERINNAVRKPIYLDSYSNRVSDISNKEETEGNLVTRPTSLGGYSNRVPQRINNVATRPTYLGDYSNKASQQINRINSARKPAYKLLNSQPYNEFPEETEEITPYESQIPPSFRRRPNSIQQQNPFRNKNFRPVNPVFEDSGNQYLPNYEKYPQRYKQIKNKNKRVSFRINPNRFKKRPRPTNVDLQNDSEQPLSFSSFVHSKHRNSQKEPENEEGTVFDSDDLYESSSKVENLDTKLSSASRQSVTDLTKDKKFRSQLKQMKGNDNIEKLVKGITNHARNSGDIPISDIEEKISDLLAEAIVAAKQTESSKTKKPNTDKGFKKLKNPLSEFFENGLVRHKIANRLSSYFSNINNDRKVYFQKPTFNSNFNSILDQKVGMLKHFNTFYKNVTTEKNGEKEDFIKVFGAKRSKTTMENELSNAKMNLMNLNSSAIYQGVSLMRSSPKVSLVESLHQNFNFLNPYLNSQNPILKSLYPSLKSQLKESPKNVFSSQPNLQHNVKDTLDKQPQRVLNQRPQKNLLFEKKSDGLGKIVIENGLKEEKKIVNLKTGRRVIRFESGLSIANKTNQLELRKTGQQKKLTQRVNNGFQGPTINHFADKTTGKKQAAIQQRYTQKNQPKTKVSFYPTNFYSPVSFSKTKHNYQEIFNTSSLVNTPTVAASLVLNKKPENVYSLIQATKKINYPVQEDHHAHYIPLPAFHLNFLKAPVSKKEKKLLINNISQGNSQTIKQNREVIIKKKNSLLKQVNQKPLLKVSNITKFAVPTPSRQKMSSMAYLKKQPVVSKMVTKSGKNAASMTEKKKLKLPSTFGDATVQNFEIFSKKSKNSGKDGYKVKNKQKIKQDVGENTQPLALSARAIAMLAVADDVEKKHRNQNGSKKVWEDKKKMQQAIIKKYEEELFHEKEENLLKEKEKALYKHAHPDMHVEYDNLIRNIKNETENFNPTKYLEVEYEANTKAQKRLVYPTMREIKRMEINFRNNNALNNILEIEKKIQDVTMSLARQNLPTPNRNYKIKVKLKSGLKNNKSKKIAFNNQSKASHKNKIETPFTPTRFISNWFLWNNYLSKLEKRNPSKHPNAIHS